MGIYMATDMSLERGNRRTFRKKDDCTLFSKTETGTNIHRRILVTSNIKKSKNYRSGLIHNITHSNSTLFQYCTLPILHPSNPTLFQSYTLPILHPSNSTHTPPQGWVRAKKFCITFDTNFGHYLPRGTIIDGSLKCWIRAFCTIAKISGEMPKKGLKTGQNGVKFFFDPHTCWILTFVAFFYFQYFFFCCFTDLLFCGN